ncbi:MAG: hypothetical protein ACK521_09180 [bacterium]
MATRKSYDGDSQKVTIHLEFDEADVGLFESLTLLIAAFGVLEFGFTYMTAFICLVEVVAYYEMLKLKIRRNKELNIQIKSKWIECYFFICFIFGTIGRSVAKMQLL